MINKITKNQYRELVERVASRIVSTRLSLPISVMVGCSAKERSIARHNSAPGTYILAMRRWQDLLGCVVDPASNFADALVEGRCSLAGDIDAILQSFHSSGLPKKRRSLDFSHAATTRARRHVVQHYDTGDEFFRQWLDKSMTYTCGYFTDSAVSLEQAQIDKMRLVCEKLQLRPSHMVIEAGCGWGALTTYMARQYDVNVLAYNLSPTQVAHARALASNEGVGSRVRIVECDARSNYEMCDRFVSIGMLEHVGKNGIADFFGRVRAVLNHDGIALVHFIGRTIPARTNSWFSRNVFPGSYLPMLSEAAAAAEEVGLQICDVENLGGDYALTLRHWHERLESAKEWITSRFDSRFYGIWSLYLRGAKAAYEVGSLSLYQVVLTHPANKAPSSRRKRERYFGSLAQRGGS